MAELDSRPLENRLTEYITSLRNIATQLRDVADILEADSAAPILGSSKLYDLIADDLQKIYNGEKLGVFAVTGEVVLPEDGA